MVLFDKKTANFNLDTMDVLFRAAGLRCNDQEIQVKETNGGRGNERLHARGQVI